MKNYLAYLILLFIPIVAEAKYPEETTWINQIKSEENSIVVLLLRNRLTKYVAKDLRPKVKTEDEDALLAHKLSMSILLLSKLTINTEIKNLLAKESELLGDVFVYGWYHRPSGEKYNLNFNLIEKELASYSQAEITKVFNKYHSLLDASYEAILLYVDNIIDDTINGNGTPNPSLSAEIAKSIQTIIDQNNGSVKVANSVYLVSTFMSENSVTLNYQINRDELTNALAKARAISFDDAVSRINSPEFKASLKAENTKYLNNYYCTLEFSKQFLRSGGVFIFNYVFDNGESASSLLTVNQTTCLSHDHKL